VTESGPRTATGFAARGPAAPEIERTASDCSNTDFTPPSWWVSLRVQRLTAPQAPLPLPAAAAGARLVPANLGGPLEPAI